MDWQEKFLNKITCGDALALMKELPDESIDLVVTSPPYDNLRDYNGYSIRPKDIARELYRIIKNGGCIVWITGDATTNFSESLTSFKQAIYFVDNIGFKLLDTMIYKKNGNPLTYPNIKRYVPSFEYMFVFCKHKPKTFNPIIDKLNKNPDKITKGSQRQKDGSTKNFKPYKSPKYSLRGNIWEYNVGYMRTTKDKIAYKHPATFPEKLVEDHIISWSNPNDIVLDIMCGSGTTCKMALLNNRSFIGFDISQQYVDLANERIKNYSNPYKM